ncbi:MAG: SpoIIE family protein phosphatase [Bacillota bacterium]
MIEQGNIKQDGGFIIKCDLEGYINEIIYNTLNVPSLEENNFFPFVVKEGTFHKGLDFIHKIKTEETVFDWELNVNLENRIAPMQFQGIKINEERLLILAVDNIESILFYYEELAKLNNQYINYIRDLIKKRMVVQPKYNSIGDNKNNQDNINSYDDLSKLNNELINLQRQLTKKNKKLQYYSEELELKNKQLEDTQTRLDEQLEKAFKIHESFLPKNLPDREKFSFGAYYQPAYKLGGDLYNFIELDGKILFYLIDVSGHGLDGALLNVFLRGTIENYLSDNENVSLSELLDYINYSYRQEEFPEDYFFCISLFLLNLETKELSFSNVGFHIPPYLVSQQGGVKELELGGLPISKAISVDSYNFSTITVDLLPGMMLFATSDGLIEEEQNGSRYGEERLKQLLLNNSDLTPQELLEVLENDIQSFIIGKDYQDDITCLAVAHKDNQGGDNNGSASTGS